MTARRIPLASIDVIDLVSRTNATIERLSAPASTLGKVWKRTAHESQQRSPEAIAWEKALRKPPKRVLLEARSRYRQDVRTALDQQVQLEGVLEEAGIPKVALTALKTWFRLATVVDITPPLESASNLALAADDDLSAAEVNDPFEPLSAAQLGQRLSVVAATVRQREQAHEVFSVLPTGRTRGRVYPAFQAWPEVTGAPLRQVLMALGQPDGGTAWGFFSSASPELENLTPVEVLSGRLVRARTLTAGAQALLDAELQVRRDAVEGAAAVVAAIRAA